MQPNANDIPSVPPLPLSQAVQTAGATWLPQWTMLQPGQRPQQGAVFAGMQQMYQMTPQNYAMMGVPGSLFPQGSMFPNAAQQGFSFSAGGYAPVQVKRENFGQRSNQRWQRSNRGPRPRTRTTHVTAPIPPPLMTETERKEVERWIDQRKKNFPRRDQANKTARSNSEKANELRDILNRQEALGVLGIAGTDGLYRRYSGNRPDVAGKRKRFDNDNDPRKRILQKGSFDRRCVVRKPMSLLDKLLYKDTRRDKSYLIQCVRFFAENNFLQNLGKKPLVFPTDAENTESPSEHHDSDSGESMDSSDELPK